MKELKRIISLAMVLILCVSLLPVNQNSLKAEAQLDDSTKLKNIILRVYDGKEWTNAVYTPEFDPNNRTYIIKLDIKYKKVQFFFEKANDNQVIEAKDHNKCPLRDSNYTEEYTLRPQVNTFWFYVKSSNVSKDRDYVFKVIRGVDSNAHSVYVNTGYRDLPRAFKGDIVRYCGSTRSSGMIFDHWLVKSNNVVLDDPYRIMGEFTMPNSDVDIEAQFKESSDDGSKLRYIIVHAMKDNVWETYYDAAKIRDGINEYELNLSEGYTEAYITLQAEDLLLDYDSSYGDKEKILEECKKHIKTKINEKSLDIDDYSYGFRTKKFVLQEGENILNFSIISRDESNASNYTLKINNGEVKYKVSFNANGAEGTMQAQKVKKGEKCTLPENGFTPPENKKFAGWKIGNETKLVGDKITVNGNTEVTAIWKDIEYKVTFNNNEGSGDMDGKLVKAGEDFELPDCTFTAPDGQEFKAWEVDGQEYPAKTKIKINKETEVKAIWKDIEYKVTFNSNEGTGEMPEQKVKKGEKCTLPENGFAPPENKKFAGWKIGNETKLVGDEITVNGNTEVTAIWKDIEYKVTFNNNEGTGEMPEKTVKKGTDFELPDCTFTAPDGQEFKAWSVEGQEYPAKAKIKINKETTIKAIWKDKTTEKFTVTIDPNNNGKNESKTEEIKKGEEFELPKCTFTAPEGQEFKAWEVDGEEYPAKTKIKINKETEVKAIWQAKLTVPNPEDENKNYEIKLTQASNGTIIINPPEAKEGELVTVQAVPDYGYELESILILDKNQNLVPMIANQFKMPKGGVSIYAKFRELAPAIYPEIEEEKPIENKRHRRDWRYDRYDEDKNTNEEEKSKSEKEIKSDESKTIITIGSQTLEKVMNGVRTVKNMDSAPYIKRGRTMLPLRYLAEALGYKVFWLNETKTVVIVDLGLRVEIPIDTNLIIVNGIKYTSDLKSEIVHHRTMLPIANIARALGLKDGEDILWDEVNRQVTINKK